MGDLRVYILTEGSHTIGLGHITRCLSLYQAFEKRCIKPKFFINGDDSIKGLVKNTDYKIANWLKENERIFEEIKDSDIVIVDSYLADSKFYKNLPKIVRLPVYLDDNKRIDYSEGIVVNGNIHATCLHYPKKEGIIYLLGTKYTPLRKEFWKISEKEIKETIQSVMISFGGYDVRNMTPKILKFLSENYRNLKKNIIIGKGFHNIDEIKSIADENTHLIYYPNAAEMKQIMLDSDIAIIAGGQTLYEVARVGIPAIVIAVADNQLKSVKGWQNSGFIEYSGWWKDKDIIDKLEVAFLNLKPIQERKKRIEIAKNCIDGKGCYRVINFLLNVLKRKYNENKI